MLAMPHWLGIKASYSLPRVSEDNASVEVPFRTAEYRPEFPNEGFDHLEAARSWEARFVTSYNVEHRHSACATSVRLSDIWARQENPGYTP